MSKAPKDKNQAEADKRRDELAKLVLKTPPQPKSEKPSRKPVKKQKPT